MAQILTEAFVAYDGTIFSNENECNQYEAATFQKTTPMLYINRENNQLLPTTTINKVDFIHFLTINNKIQFKSLRTNKDDQNRDFRETYEQSIQGLLDNETLGTFCLTYTQERQWIWMPLLTYQEYIQKELNLTIDAKLLLARMYAYK